MDSDSEQQAKLHHFLQWLLVNGVELRGCEIRYSSSHKGFGIFSSGKINEGVLLVVPLSLAITPMTVLQDPTYASKLRPLLEEGDVDDRFLMMLFLMVERCRRDSLWKPYLDMLPCTFGSPLWFTEGELLDLEGTNLHKATLLQKRSLRSLFDNKAKPIAEELFLDFGIEAGIDFQDFLWANSIFWTRALNLPLPQSFVFPELSEKQENDYSSVDHVIGSTEEASEPEPAKTQAETVLVEGLVPGIDFCNHDFKARTLWDVDRKGDATGVPMSMYLSTVSFEGDQHESTAEEEIHISYGNKGNEELLFLYGFIVENNANDFLMVHYPMEAFQHVCCADAKRQLLDVQKAELRCLLPRVLLQNGFFSETNETKSSSVNEGTSYANFSWSGQSKVPSYLNKLIFPEVFLAGLRTIAMQEKELFQVSSLLEELVGSKGERQPTQSEVRTAIWEVCDDAGALQLLVDLLGAKGLWNRRRRQEAP